MGLLKNRQYFSTWQKNESVWDFFDHQHDHDQVSSKGEQNEQLKVSICVY